MSTSPTKDDKSRVANRGQKRNFSFESHASTMTTSTAAASVVARMDKGQVVPEREADGFDINALVSELDRAVENGSSRSNLEDLSSGQLIHLMENMASSSRRGDEFDTDEMSTTETSSNNTNNITDSSSGDSFLQRPISSNQDSKSLSPVDLQVTNLDQTIDQREMKKILLSVFSEHVKVLNVSVFFQSDGNMAASVRVGSPQEAQIAIAHLHRRKLGYKRILISNNQIHNSNPNMLRSKVGSLLAEVPNGRLQLFKFREMYEKRYHDSIGVSDLYKMKDVVAISEDQSGRMIQLLPNWFCSAQFHSGFNLNNNNNHMNFPPLDYGQNTIAPSSGMFSSGLPGTLRPHNYLPSASAGTLPFSSQPHPNALASSGGPPVLDSAFCLIHCADAAVGKVGWAEKENGTLLPTVNIALSVLSPNLKQLIQSHSGTLPLASLTACYAAVFPPGFQIDNEDGVPLEHLVSCVRGVAIQQSPSGIKQIVSVGVASQPQLPGFGDGLLHSDEGLGIFGQLRQMSSAGSTASSSLTNLTTFGLNSQQPITAAPLAGQLALFSRELVDLLKTSSGCRMPFSKFIPAYHRRFDRQCRVADYGYTKLKDLFEALPHVVQIMGDGSKAIITLAHRAQVKRFTNDLLKVLKAQPSKQISILDLPTCFEKSQGKPFKVSDYGVCELEDILHEVSETTVVLSGSGDDMMVAIPKREQTQSEVERTHQFAQECIELLRHVPDCRLNFNKFIPAYHQHFSRQCRVSDYGFTKLIELFEAIPNTVEITEDADGERMLQLTDSERLTVLEDQITTLVAHSNNNNIANNNNNNNILPKSLAKQIIRLDDLEEAYMNQFGYQLRPDTYGESTIIGLLKNKLSQSLRVEQDDAGDYHIRLIDRSYIKALAGQVREVLATDPEGSMSLDWFIQVFEEKNGIKPDLSQLRNDLADWIEFFETDSPKPIEPTKVAAQALDDDEKLPTLPNVEEEDEEEGDEEGESEKKEKIECIRLKPLQLCIIKIQTLLKDHQDKLLMSEFEAAFSEKFGTALCPGQYGYPSLLAMMQSQVMADEKFLIRGRGVRKMIWFMRDGGPVLPCGEMNPPSNGVSSNLLYQHPQDRYPSSISSYSMQNRYPPYRREASTSRLGSMYGGSSGGSFGGVGRNTNFGGGPLTAAAMANRGGNLQPSFTRTFRGAQAPPVNRNRFVYPPPGQNPIGNFQLPGFQHQPQLQQQQQQSSMTQMDVNFWGNLAQFGLFPNGRGGVAPAGSGAPGMQNSMPYIDPPIMRMGPTSGGGAMCGRNSGGGLMPPPPLPRLSPSNIGSPVHHGISSLLPTPHSPSPMMSAGHSPFMFPPSSYWQNPMASPGSYNYK